MATVNTRHSSYDAMIERWKLCRDLAVGQWAVHNAGKKYLPLLTDEKGENYAIRLYHSPLYNAYWRTISGLAGMVFRKPPVITADANVTAMLDDVTMSGKSMLVFSRQVVEEALITGRVGLLVDYPEAGITGITFADAQSLNLRPSMQLFNAESIINWHTGKINNVTVLTMVVLQETAEIAKNEFEITYEPRYRVLDLDEGIYRQRLYRINEKNEDELVNVYYPMMNNQQMDYIPFVFLGVDNTTAAVEEPSLIDLADLNIAHYRVASSYENGCLLTGRAQVCIFGFSPDENQSLYYGGGAWAFPDPSTSASILSLNNDFVALSGNMQKKEQMMAVLGARILAPERRAVESAEAASIHRSGENSLLSAMAQNLSDGLTQALSIFGEWAGSQGNETIQLNRDFTNLPLTAQELTSIVSAWQSGAISHETLFYNLKQGETYPDDIDFEDEQARIESNPVNMSTISK